MTALPQFDPILDLAHSSLAAAFFWFGDETHRLITSGECTHISSAGMTVSEYCRIQRQSFGGHKITTAFVYSAHQAATKYNKIERQVFIKHNCPFHVLKTLVVQPKEAVAEILEDVQKGKCDWQGCTKRRHKPPSVRRAKHWAKVDEAINLPRGEVAGCRAPARREASEMNPPVQADVEDPESVRSALLTMMTRRHQAILSDWNAAAERYNKGKNPEYCLPLLKTR